MQAQRSTFPINFVFVNVVHSFIIQVKWLHSIVLYTLHSKKVYDIAYITYEGGDDESGREKNQCLHKPGNGGHLDR